ncbi:MAG: hypothetical protein LBD48_14985 [Treponema sp.]|jgi:hypothetical protein|nr:hypothetical protein [Treponema sp.]
MNPYLIPQTVYVGDRAVLVLPLPDMALVPGGKESVISMDRNNFPFAPDIEFYRIALERRASGSRLLVEFSAYTPGILELPVIEIGGGRFAGLRLEIASIIGSGQAGTVLSGPASPLAIPGTSVLVYGTMTSLILILLLFFWAALWGRKRMYGWIQKWKRRRLIVSMSGIEKRLRKSLLKYGNKRDILNTLSAEFRGFLSFFTGENCRAMTAPEFGRLASLLPAGPAPTNDNTINNYDNTINNSEKISGNNAAGDTSANSNARYEAAAEILSGGFLGAFFSRCDGLRFSGAVILSDEVIAVLGDLRRFLWTLDRIERGKIRRKEAAA